MRIAEVYDYLLNESHNLEFEKIEKFLKIKIKNEKYLPMKQELILLLLICLLKKNAIESNEMRFFFDELIAMILKLKTDLSKQYKKDNNQQTKILLDVFYKTNIYRLYFLEILYIKVNLTDRSQKIRVLRKDLERADSFYRAHYWAYFWLLLDKLFSNYGTNFWYLFWVLIFLTYLFWLIFRFDDVFINPEIHYVGIDQIQSFWYYVYISLTTITNLWADSSMAATLWLRLMFWLEQIIWVIMFWILIILLGKKFN